MLREFLDHGVVVYLDDIRIYSKKMEGHEALGGQVLARLERHDLALSLKKSVLHVNTVEFQGYIVVKNGVTMTEKKVESIFNWRAPRSVKDVQIFPGFATFYRHFIEKSFKGLETNYRHVEHQGRKRYMVLGRRRGQSL